MILVLGHQCQLRADKDRRSLPVVDGSRFVFHPASELHEEKCRSAPDTVKRRDGDVKGEQ
jgi:hypothetical protein